jgi:predicted TIM-barrel fold metal-dependent hydrolase
MTAEGGWAHEVLTATAPLVDHHCHGLDPGWTVAAGPSWPSWRRCFSESPDERVLARDVPELLGYRHFRAALAWQLGADADEGALVAARDRLAAADPDGYLRRLLDSAGIAELLVDTGFGGPGTVGPGPLAAASGRPVREIVRLESVAEAILKDGGRPIGSAGAFVAAFEERLAEAVRGGAVALKSVLAYRGGLRLDHHPRSGELRAAFTAMGRSRQARRLDDPVVLPFLVWRAAELAAGTGTPLQFHTGFGDPDLDLRLADPALLTPLLRDPRTAACPLMLLHCYPYVGAAAYLAGTYEQAYMDLSLAVPLAEPAAPALLREALGLCPASKLLAASDGHGYPEMHWWGAMVWRRALDDVLAAEVVAGALDEASAIAVAAGILGGNARRLYRLPAHPA